MRWEDEDCNSTCTSSEQESLQSASCRCDWQQKSRKGAERTSVGTPFPCYIISVSSGDLETFCFGRCICLVVFDSCHQTVLSLTLLNFFLSQSLHHSAKGNFSISINSHSLAFFSRPFRYTLTSTDAAGLPWWPLHEKAVCLFLHLVSYFLTVNSREDIHVHSMTAQLL